MNNSELTKCSSGVARKASCYLLLMLALATLHLEAQTTSVTESQKRFATLNIPFDADRFVQFSAQGDLAVVTAFIDAGMNPNVRESLRLGTPLINAAANGHVLVAQKLLEANAKVDGSDSYGCTPLISAAYYGRLETVKLLVAKGANASAEPASCIAPLAAAVVSGKIEIVQAMLSAGADPRARTFSGGNALIVAAHAGRLEIAKRLLAFRYTKSNLMMAEEAARTSGHTMLADLIAETARNG